MGHRPDALLVNEGPGAVWLQRHRVLARHGLQLGLDCHGDLQPAHPEEDTVSPFDLVQSCTSDLSATSVLAIASLHARSTYRVTLTGTTLESQRSSRPRYHRLQRSEKGWEAFFCRTSRLDDLLSRQRGSTTTITTAFTACLPIHSIPLWSLREKSGRPAEPRVQCPSGRAAPHGPLLAMHSTPIGRRRTAPMPRPQNPTRCAAASASRSRRTPTSSYRHACAKVTPPCHPAEACPLPLGPMPPSDRNCRPRFHAPQARSYTCIQSACGGGRRPSVAHSGAPSTVRVLLSHAPAWAMCIALSSHVSYAITTAVCICTGEAIFETLPRCHVDTDPS